MGVSIVIAKQSLRNARVLERMKATELLLEELLSGKAPSVTRRGFCCAFFVDIRESMGGLGGGLISGPRVSNKDDKSPS